jgi:hypothetical protein
MFSKSKRSFYVFRLIYDDCCWGLILKCYELRTRQHKMLKVKGPSSIEALFPLGYNDLQKKVTKDIPSSSQYIVMKEEAYET